MKDRLDTGGRFGYDLEDDLEEETVVEEEEDYVEVRSLHTGLSGIALRADHPSWQAGTNAPAPFVSCVPHMNLTLCFLEQPQTVLSQDS